MVKVARERRLNAIMPRLRGELEPVILGLMRPFGRHASPSAHHRQLIALSPEREKERDLERGKGNEEERENLGVRKKEKTTDSGGKGKSPRLRWGW